MYFNQRSTITKIYETQGYQPRISRYIPRAVGFTTSKDNKHPTIHSHQAGEMQEGEEAPLNRYDLRANDRRRIPQPRHATPFSVDTS